MTLDASRIASIVALAKSYGVTRLILFGSATEGGPDVRDIDLACDGVPGWKLFDLAARIEEALGIPVDLIPLVPETRFTRTLLRKGKVLL